jgi:hypothetical protein
MIQHAFDDSVGYRERNWSAGVSDERVGLSCNMDIEKRIATLYALASAALPRQWSRGLSHLRIEPGRDPVDDGILDTKVTVWRLGAAVP